MPRVAQKPPKTETPQLCRGCVYLVHKFKTKNPSNYKCDASGITTYPDRTACTLWKARS